MYNLQKRINSGIEVDLDALLLRQNKEWLRVCSKATELRSSANMDEFILSKRKVLEFLVQRYPHLVTLLTQVSGTIELSSRRLRFVAMLYYGDSKAIPKEVDSLASLLCSLELFDCCQEVSNSFRKKSGKGAYNFKLMLSPLLHSKQFDGDVLTLARVVLGENTYSNNTLGIKLVDCLRTEVGLHEGARLTTSEIPDWVIADDLDLLLEFAEKDEDCKYLNKFIVRYVKDYNRENIKERSGRVETFYPSFKEYFFQKYTGSVITSLRGEFNGTDWDLSGDALVLLTPTLMLRKSKEVIAVDLDLHYVSPFCVTQGEERMSCINHKLGYVGTYIDRGELIQQKLVSDYNPVVMFRFNERSGNLEKVWMYNQSWVRSADDVETETSVMGMSVCEYLDYPFSLDNVVCDEGSGSTLESYLESFDKYIVGEKSYKQEVKNSLETMLRVLLDTELCLSSHTLDSINSLSPMEIELISDTDGLLSFVLD